MRPIDRIVIHHSASPRRTTTLENIASWHKARGWNRVGYHYVIEGTGMIRLGRHEDQVGAHALHHNLKSIGICVVGDNTKDDEGWNEVQVAMLRSLVYDLTNRYRDASVCGHRDLPGAATECPGLNVQALLAKET